MDLSKLQSREAVGRAVDLLRKVDPGEELRFLHVCGTHENTITRYGLRSIVPRNIGVVAGPGCPVCVTSTSAIDQAIEIAQNHARMYTYGDMFTVPGGSGSLKDARAGGARVKVVYSASDAVRLAEASVEESTFFSIGFETTVPATASVVLSGVPDNMSFITSHRLIPPALLALLRSGRIEIDGLICPGHVSTIIGTEPYRFLVEDFGIPVAVSGFEPLDVIVSLIDLVKQHVDRDPRVYNEYTRAVRPEGNRVAMDMVERVFEVCDEEWRGIGTLPSSGLRLREEFSDLDAVERYGIGERASKGMPAGCRCSEVLLGSSQPTDCPHFGSGCTPDRPIGPCMVSSEGTCRIWFQYGGRRDY
jgi:hydrogenase expression/formation protein HypD